MRRSVGTDVVDEKSFIYDGETYIKSLLADIHNAENTVVISSPYVSARRLKTAEPVLKEATRRGIKVEIRTKDAGAYKKTSQMIDRALASLSSIQIHRSEDEYLKYVVIDGRIVWYGSIDVLGSINRQDSFMRLVSGSIAMMLTDK